MLRLMIFIAFCVIFLQVEELVGIPNGVIKINAQVKGGESNRYNIHSYSLLYINSQTEGNDGLYFVHGRKIELIYGGNFYALSFKMTGSGILEVTNRHSEPVYFDFKITSYPF